MNMNVNINISDGLWNVMKSKMRELDMDLTEFIEISIMKANNIYLMDLISQEKSDQLTNKTDKVNVGYYIYVYLDPRQKGNYKYAEYEFDYQPIYVGKGIYDRVNSHINKTHNKLFDKFLKTLFKLGFEPKIIKIHENISSTKAHEYENNLINLIGRLDLNTGPLFNLTGGMTQKEITIDNSNSIEYSTNRLLLNALNKSKTIKDAARNIGISERTLYRKIKALGIQKVNGIYNFKS